MKILVTGGAGYLGSVLIPRLLGVGEEVTVVDRFFFGRQSMPLQFPRLRLVEADTRYVSGKVFEGHDAVIDLAALSNDPTGEMDPWKTFDINYLGRLRTARLARQAGVRRYILASSCSVYGSSEQVCDEQTVPKPLTMYAKANVWAEQGNLPLNYFAGMMTTAVRMATLYGLSPKMRFDLAVNRMILDGWRSGTIKVQQPGTQWRPFVHVDDAARAIQGLLSQEEYRIGEQVFNIGSDEQNYQIYQLAELIGSKLLKGKPQQGFYGDPDNRSYKVDFTKALGGLGFSPRHDIESTVIGMETALHEGKVFDEPQTHTQAWYQRLISEGVEI